MSMKCQSRKCNLYYLDHAFVNETVELHFRRTISYERTNVESITYVVDS